MYNIPKNVKEIENNKKPARALEMENHFGKNAYGGSCPPSRTHRYDFTVYAFDVEQLEGLNKRNFFDKVEEHIIEKAAIKGLYKRRR